MHYISTRGQAPALSFEEAVLTGLATDGGLYVPENIPQFSREQIAAWAGLPYNELAFEVIKPFVDGEIEDADLKDIIDRSYQTFRHSAVAPLVQLENNLWVMELFHGPTLAFKDFALQFLGNLFDHLLEKRGQKVVVMGATSGDTGSAAIEGCKRCKNIDIFILHPHNRVSDVQRRQMTSILEPNVHNIALEGNFDDCQNMVKASFADQSFLPEDRQLAAVNSINWARIMAQVVYYFHAALSLGGPHRAVSFSVPTGNFGDIFAGYIAKQMGLPIEQLVIATNANDVLHRCISNNDFSKQPLVHSLSPSMDIMISSNFERLLFDLYNRDGEAIRQLMSDFNNGQASMEETALAKARELFSSYRCDDDRMVEVIAREYDNSDYLLDPHTATGVDAARACRRGTDVPMVCLSTAHPAKFPEAVRKAGYPQDPPLPHHMADLFERKERYTVKDNDLKTIQEFVARNL
ncbi:threonine synthase [Porticoccus sp. W117]|uniref:threonine synthase n=1 Tax=Porticoccus sp. W117 TaxID=3054777 RepID=UPI002593E6FA|nr:threonine synthase [Porticoccus sp. W117]MDM3871651.1 threonine synthase [Porticoccus sp. W117]